MKIVFKTRNRFPLYHSLLVLLISLGSAFFYLNHSTRQPEKPVQASLVAFPPLAPKAAAPPVEENIVKTFSIGRNETFGELMQGCGFDPFTVQEIYQRTKESYNLAQIHPGRSLTVITTPENEFEKLEYSIDPIQTLVIQKSDGEITSEIRKRTIETQVLELGGYIKGSLYSSITKLGEDDELIITFADIFEWDVDFFKDLQEGDSFRMVYEKLLIEGKPHANGRILAAELINKGKVYTAIGYQHQGKFEYYTPEGRPMRKAFLAAPLKFSRISSGFTRSRYHPVLKKRRPHYGIDYAAPAGTPVRAIGSGKIILAGWAGGAGKTVKIQHDREIATVYCHLSRYASGIRQGVSVRQGQVIGYVGSTGLATGPHLDFRFLKNGKYINFLSIKSPQAEPLSASELVKFRESTTGLSIQLASVQLRDLNQEMASLSTPSSTAAR